MGCRNNPSSVQSEPDTTATRPAPERASSILGLVEDQPSLSTLFTLIHKVDLDSTLSSEGPFTLFAPTNAAFSDLEEATNTLSDSRLREILKYHVVETRLRVADVPADMQIGTLNNRRLHLQPTEEGLSLTDIDGNPVSIITPDLDASNGVIHIIDNVLDRGS